MSKILYCVLHGEITEFRTTFPAPSPASDVDTDEWIAILDAHNETHGYRFCEECAREDRRKLGISEAVDEVQDFEEMLQGLIEDLGPEKAHEEIKRLLGHQYGETTGKLSPNVECSLHPGAMVDHYTGDNPYVFCRTCYLNDIGKALLSPELNIRFEIGPEHRDPHSPLYRENWRTDDWFEHWRREKEQELGKNAVDAILIAHLGRLPGQTPSHHRIHLDRFGRVVKRLDTQ